VTFVAIRGAARRLFSPIGLELVDDFLTTPTSLGPAMPLGPITARLDVDDGAGNFVPIDASHVITSQAVLTFPGIGRVPRPATATPTSYRVRIESPLYRPLYRATADGITFVAPPWNDDEPAALTPTFGRAILLPAFNYQFPSYTPVLRGEVVDTAGDPVPDALVIETTTGARALTDERGAFALALRWVPPGNATIDASDRFGHTGSLTVVLPADLAHGQLIAIS
jgi:hypothetical protein